MGIGTFCHVDPFHFQMPLLAANPTHMLPGPSRVITWLSSCGRPFAWVSLDHVPDALRIAIPANHRLVTQRRPDWSYAIRPHRSEVLESTDCHCHGNAPAALRNHIPVLENHTAPEG